MGDNKITVRGILRGGRTLELTEELGLPPHLPDVPVTVRVGLPMPKGIVREGRTLVLEEIPPLPEQLPDLPVTIELEFPVGLGILKSFGVWNEAEFEETMRELEFVRYGRPLSPEERCLIA